jgi:hypothetical protein
MMRHRLLFAMVALLVGFGLVMAVTSIPTRKITLEEFAKLKPFKGEVVAIERIPWPKGYVPKSVSGPHYRLTVQKKDDSRLVIERAETLLPGGPDRLVQHLLKGEATYPIDLLKDVNQDR